MNTKPFGKLVGVGLGPGDPELMTLKAVRHIQQADVIAYPAAEGIPSFARSIAAGAHTPRTDRIPHGNAHEG